MFLHNEKNVTVDIKSLTMHRYHSETESNYI